MERVSSQASARDARPGEQLLADFRRGRAMRARAVETVEWLTRYFDPVVRGLENVPEGPCLLVSNHSGGVWMPDALSLAASWYRERGLDTPLFALAHDMLFDYPWLGPRLTRLGAIPAHPRHTAAVLSAGHAVLVYPGGDWEAHRPYWESNRVDLAGRKGFLRTALRHGVPIVPVVSHGSHQTVLTLSRGDFIARRLKLAGDLRVHVFPIGLTIPWGLTMTGIPHWPLPAKIDVQVGEPLRWPELGPEDAGEPRVLDRLYAEVVDTMQGMLDELVRVRPNPYARRSPEGALDAPLAAG